MEIYCGYYMAQLRNHILNLNELFHILSDNVANYIYTYIRLYLCPIVVDSVVDCSVQCS